MLLEFTERNKTMLCAVPTVTEEDGTIRYVKCSFTFTSSLWLNMVTKRAVFKSASYGTSDEVILDSSDCCYMPTEVYEHGGVVQVILYGDYLSGTKKRAVMFYLGPVNVFFGRNPVLPVPVPSKYDVFVAEYTNLVNQNTQLIEQMSTLIDEFSNIDPITDVTLNGDSVVDEDGVAAIEATLVQIVRW